MQTMSSQLDIFDENGNSLGYTEEGVAAHDKRLWHKTAHIWIINPNGELLFQQRNRNDRKHPNAWDISAAGHIRSLETTRTGGVRELYDEIGILASPEDLIFLFNIKSEKSHHHNDVFLLPLDFPAEKCVFRDGEACGAKYISWRTVAGMSDQELSDNKILKHNEFTGLFEYLEKNGF